MSRIHIASWRERYLYSWRRSYCSPDALRERNLLRLGEPWIGFWLYFSISGHLGAKVLGKLVDSCSYAWFSSCWPWVQGFHLRMLGPPSLEYPAWRTRESNLPSMVESTWGMKDPLRYATSNYHNSGEAWAPQWQGWKIVKRYLFQDKIVNFKSHLLGRGYPKNFTPRLKTYHTKS